MNPCARGYCYIFFLFFFVEFGCKADLTSSAGLKTNEGSKTRRLLIHNATIGTQTHPVRWKKRSKHDWKTRRKRYIIRSRPMSAMALQYAIYSLRSQKRFPVRRDLDPWDPSGYAKITSNADVHNDDEGETRVFTSIKRSIEDETPGIPSYLDSESFDTNLPASFATLAPPALTDAFSPYINTKSEIPNNFMGSNMQIYTDNFGSPIMSMSSTGADYRYSSEKRSRVPNNSVQQINSHEPRDYNEIGKRSIKDTSRWLKQHTNRKYSPSAFRQSIPVLPLKIAPRKFAFSPVASKLSNQFNQPFKPFVNKRALVVKPGYAQVRAFNPFVPQRPGEYPLLSLITPTATLDSISLEPLPVKFYQRDKSINPSTQTSNTLNINTQHAISNNMAYKPRVVPQPLAQTKQAFSASPAESYKTQKEQTKQAFTSSLLGSYNSQSSDYKFISILKHKKPIDTGNNFYVSHSYDILDKFKKVARPVPVANSLEKVKTTAEYAKEFLPSAQGLMVYNAKMALKRFPGYANRVPMIASKRILDRNVVKGKNKMHKFIPMLGSVLIVPPSIKFNNIDSERQRAIKISNKTSFLIKSFSESTSTNLLNKSEFNKYLEKKNLHKDSIKIKPSVNRREHEAKTLYFLDENKSLVNYTIPGNEGRYLHRSLDLVGTKRDNIVGAPLDPVAEFEKEVDDMANNETEAISALQHGDSPTSNSSNDQSKEDFSNLVQIWFSNQTDIENSKQLKPDVNESTSFNETNESLLSSSQEWKVNANQTNEEKSVNETMKQTEFTGQSQVEKRYNVLTPRIRNRINRNDLLKEKISYHTSPIKTTKNTFFISNLKKRKTKRYNTLKTHYLISSKNYKNRVADAMKRTQVIPTKYVLPNINTLESKIRNTFLDNQKTIISLAHELKQSNGTKRNSLIDSMKRGKDNTIILKSAISENQVTTNSSTVRHNQTKPLSPSKNKSQTLAQKREGLNRQSDLKEKTFVQMIETLNNKNEHKNSTLEQKKESLNHKKVQKNSNLAQKIENLHRKNEQKKDHSPRGLFQGDAHFRSRLMNETVLASQIISKLNTNIKYLIQAEKKQLMENLIEKKQGIAVKKHFLNRETTKDALGHINSDIEDLMCQYRNIVPVFHPSQYALSCKNRGNKRMKGNSSSDIPWNLYNIKYVVKRLNDNLRFIIENHKMFKSQGYKNKNGKFERYNLTKVFPIKKMKFRKANEASDMFPTQGASKPTGKYTNTQNSKNSPSKGGNKNSVESPTKQRKIMVEFIVPTSKNGSIIWPYATASDNLNDETSYDVTISPSKANKNNLVTNKSTENKKLINNLKQLNEIANKMKDDDNTKDNDTSNDIPEIGEDELNELISNVYNLTHSLSRTYNQNEVEGIKTLESLSQELTGKYASSAKQQWKKLSDDLIRITKKEGIPTKRVHIVKNDDVNSKLDFDSNKRSSSGGNNDGMNVIEDNNDTETEIEKKENVVHYKHGNVRLDQQSIEIASMLSEIDQDEMRSLNQGEDPVFPNRNVHLRPFTQKMKSGNSNKKDIVKQYSSIDHVSEKDRDYSQIVKDFQNLADDIITHSDIQSDTEGINTLTKMFNEIEKVNETKNERAKISNFSEKTIQNLTASSEITNSSHSDKNNHINAIEINRDKIRTDMESQNTSGIIETNESNKTAEKNDTFVSNVIEFMEKVQTNDTSRDNDTVNLSQAQSVHSNSSKKDDISADMEKMYKIIEHVKRHINNNIQVFKMLKQKMGANNMSVDLLNYFNPQIKSSDNANRPANYPDRRTEVVSFVYPDDKYDEINNIIHEFMSQSQRDQQKKSGTTPVDEVYSRIYKKLDDVQGKVDKIIQNIEKEAEKKQNAIQQRQDELIQKVGQKKPSRKSSLVRYRTVKNHLAKKDNNTQQKSVIVLKRVDMKKKRKIGGDGKAYIKFAKPMIDLGQDGLNLEQKIDLDGDLVEKEKKIESEALKNVFKSDDRKDRLDLKSNSFTREFRNETEDSSDEVSRNMNNTVFVTDTFNNEIDFKVNGVHRPIEDSTGNPLTYNKVIPSNVTNITRQYLNNSVTDDVSNELKVAKMEANVKPLKTILPTKRGHAEKTYKILNNTNTVADMKFKPSATATSNRNNNYNLTQSTHPHKLPYASFDDNAYDSVLSTGEDKDYQNQVKNFDSTYRDYQRTGKFQNRYDISDGGDDDETSTHVQKSNPSGVTIVGECKGPNNGREAIDVAHGDEEDSDADEYIGLGEEEKKEPAKDRSGDSEEAKVKKTVEVTESKSVATEKVNEEKQERVSEEIQEKVSKEKQEKINKERQKEEINKKHKEKEKKKGAKKDKVKEKEKEKMLEEKIEKQKDTLAVVEEEDKENRTKVVKTLSDFVDILKNNFQTVKSMLANSVQKNETGVKDDAVEKTEKEKEEEGLKNNSTENKPGVVFEYDVIDNNSTVEANNANSYNENEEKKTNATVTETDFHLRNVTSVPSATSENEKSSMPDKSNSKETTEPVSTRKVNKTKMTERQISQLTDVIETIIREKLKDNANMVASYFNDSKSSTNSDEPALFIVKKNITMDTAKLDTPLHNSVQNSTNDVENNGSFNNARKNITTEYLANNMWTHKNQEDVKLPIFEDDEKMTTQNIKDEGMSRKVKDEGHLPSYVGNNTNDDDFKQSHNLGETIKINENKVDKMPSFIGAQKNENSTNEEQNLGEIIPSLVGESQLIKDLKLNNSKRKDFLIGENYLDNAISKSLVNTSDELPRNISGNFKYLILPPKSYTIISTPFETSNIKFMKQDSDKFALDITPSNNALDKFVKDKVKHDDGKNNLDDVNKNKNAEAPIGIPNATISSLLGNVHFETLNEKPTNKNDESSKVIYHFTNTSNVDAKNAAVTESTVKVNNATVSDSNNSNNAVDEYFNEVESKTNASLTKDARIVARKKKINETLKFIDIMEGEINQLLDEDKRHEAFLKLTNSPHRESMGKKETDEGLGKFLKSDVDNLPTEVPTEGAATVYGNRKDTTTQKYKTKKKKEKKKKKKQMKTQKHENQMSTKDYFKNFDSNILNQKDTFGYLPKEYMEPTAGQPQYATTQSPWKKIYDQTENNFISTPIDDGVKKVSRSKPTYTNVKQRKTTAPWNDYLGAEMDLNKGMLMKDGVNPNFDSSYADTSGPSVNNVKQNMNDNTEYNIENELMKADSAAFGVKPVYETKVHYQSPSIDTLVSPIKTDDVPLTPSSKPTVKTMEEFDPAKTPIQEDEKYQGVENYEGVEEQPNLKRSNGNYINNNGLLDNELNLGQTKVTDGPFQYTVKTAQPYANITNYIRKSDELGEIKQANYVNNFQRNEMSDALSELRKETTNGLKSLFTTAVEKQRNFIDNIENGGQPNAILPRTNQMYPEKSPSTLQNPTRNYAGTTPEMLGTPIGKIDDSITSQSIGPPIGKIVDSSTLQPAFSPTTNIDDSVIPQPTAMQFTGPSQVQGRVKYNIAIDIGRNGRAAEPTVPYDM